MSLNRTSVTLEKVKLNFNKFPLQQLKQTMAAAWWIQKWSCLVRKLGNNCLVHWHNKTFSFSKPHHGFKTFKLLVIINPIYFKYVNFPSLVTCNMVHSIQFRITYTTLTDVVNVNNLFLYTQIKLYGLNSFNFYRKIFNFWLN